MIWDLILNVSTALFAVFGFACALRALAEWFFAPPNLTMAVEVRNKEDADMLDMLLHEARSAFLRKGRRRLVVLISTDLMNGIVGHGDLLFSEYEDLLARYGAESYLIDID